MRKELEEVREVLLTINEGDYQYIEGSQMYSDVSKALKTLDHILNQDEAELVEKAAKALCGVNDPLNTDDPNLWHEHARAALRAVGLIKEENDGV